MVESEDWEVYCRVFMSEIVLCPPRMGRYARPSRISSGESVYLHFTSIIGHGGLSGSSVVIGAIMQS